jgi:hypothetical protein
MGAGKKDMEEEEREKREQEQEREENGEKTHTRGIKISSIRRLRQV